MHLLLQIVMDCIGLLNSHEKIRLCYNNIVINVEIDFYNVHIEDSYKIKKIKDMKFILNYLTYRVDNNYAIHNMSLFNMINEWRCHNLLYAFRLFKRKTKSVDLNVNKKYIFNILYFIGSIFYF